MAGTSPGLSNRAVPPSVRARPPPIDLRGRSPVEETRRALERIRRLISSPGFLLFVFFLLLYMVTLKVVMTSDTISNSWLPWVILKKHTIALDVLYKHVGSTYYLFLHNGHYYSVFNLGSALAALPVYLIPSIFIGQLTMLNALLLGKISCAVLISLSVVFIYYAARNISTRSKALVVAVIFGAATSVWSITSQVFFNNVGAVFFVSLGLMLAAKSERDWRYRWAFGAGMAFTLGALARPSVALYVVIFAVFALGRKSPKRFAAYVCGAALPAALILWYNAASFGSPLTFGQSVEAYYLLSRTSWSLSQHLWITPFLKGLAGITISPSRGIFVFSPVLLFSIVGVVLVLKYRYPRILIYSLLCVVAGLISTAKWFSWGGGWGYGYRLTIELVPFLCLLLLPALGWIRRRKVALGIFVVLLAFSIAVQVVGYISCDFVSWERPLGDKNVEEISFRLPGQLYYEFKNFGFYVSPVLRKAFDAGIDLKLDDMFLSHKAGDEKFNITVEVPESCFLGLAARSDNAEPLMLQTITIPKGTSTVCFSERYLGDKYSKLYMATSDIAEVARREWQAQIPGDLPHRAPPKLAYETYPVGVDASKVVVRDSSEESVMLSLTKYVIDRSPPGFLVRTSVFRIDGNRVHAVYVDDMHVNRKITVDAEISGSSWKNPEIKITK